MWEVLLTFLQEKKLTNERTTPVQPKANDDTNDNAIDDANQASPKDSHSRNQNKKSNQATREPILGPNAMPKAATTNSTSKSISCPTILDANTRKPFNVDPCLQTSIPTRITSQTII